MVSKSKVVTGILDSWINKSILTFQNTANRGEIMKELTFQSFSGNFSLGVSLDCWDRKFLISSKLNFVHCLGPHGNSSLTKNKNRDLGPALWYSIGSSPSCSTPVLVPASGLGKPVKMIQVLGYLHPCWRSGRTTGSWMLALDGFSSQT